jgi:hypothetical protein
VAESGPAVEALVAALGRTNDPPALISLAHALGAVVAHLEPGKAAARAGQVADALTAAIARINDSAALTSLAQGLGTVGSRLEAGKAADAIAAVMAGVSDDSALGALAEGLASAGERLGMADLLVFLQQQPLAAGKAQRALLDVLGRRTRRSFRSTWQFLEWAASNGLEFTPPSNAATAR